MYNPYLETFLTVADCGSFTQAADTLMLSPTAVMKQINALEAELDLSLFKRTHQGVKLTPSGRIICQAAEEIIAYSKKKLAEAKEADHQENHTIIIGTSTICSCLPVVNRWSQIAEKHPELTIQIIPFEENHTSALMHLKNDSAHFDLIVTPCDSSKWLEEVNFQKLADIAYCVSVPRHHPLADKKIIDFADLDHQTIMMINNGDSKTTNRLRKALQKNCHDITIDPLPFFYDMNTFNRCVAENHVLMSLDIWKDIHPMLVSIPLRERFTLPYGIIYHKHANSHVNAFIHYISTSS